MDPHSNPCIIPNDIVVGFVLFHSFALGLPAVSFFAQGSKHVCNVHRVPNMLVLELFWGLPEHATCLCTSLDIIGYGGFSGSLHLRSLHAHLTAVNSGRRLRVSSFKDVTLTRRVIWRKKHSRSSQLAACISC